VTDIDTAEVRRLFRMKGLTQSGLLAEQLCDEIDRLREDNEDLSLLINALDKPVIKTYRWEDVKKFLDAEKRAKVAEARLAAVVNEATGRGLPGDPALNEWGLGYAQAMADVRAAIEETTGE